MLLYLARHAQTASSAVDGFNGQRELPLTPRGRQQARALGARLAEVRFSAAYRSPLSRTGETAALVAPQLQPIVVPGLIEIDYGEWEGLTPQEAESRYPARFAAWVADPAHVGPPGGETASQIAARALEALEWIRRRHDEGDGSPPPGSPGLAAWLKDQEQTSGAGAAWFKEPLEEGPALAFCHKATLRVLGCALAGAPLGHYRTRFAQDECALNLVELRKGKAPFLRLWNDTSHLAADPGAALRGAH